MAKDPNKGPGGRPSKYKPEYCELLVQHLSEGRAIESFPATIYKESGGKERCCKDTVYEWFRQHPEFSYAKKIGEALSYGWWESAGMDSLKDSQGFNNTVWVFSMKNRFGWRDKVEQTVTADVNHRAPEDLKGADAEVVLDEVKRVLD